MGIIRMECSWSEGMNLLSRPYSYMPYHARGARDYLGPIARRLLMKIVAAITNI